MGGLAGAGALPKKDSGDDEAQTAVTGMLPTTSYHGDEGPKGDKGNRTANNQSQGEVDRMDRKGESHTTDSPKDGSSDEAAHAGSSRGGTASGTEIAG